MLPIALTPGDPAGIGPDITLLAWVDRAATALPAFVVVGDAEALSTRATELGLTVPIQRVGHASEAVSAFADALPVLHQPLPEHPRAGAPTAENGAAVIRTIETASVLAMQGHVRAVTTAPIAKHVLYRAGFTHPGHTEFLHALSLINAPSKTAPRPVMLLVADDLRAAPLTIHEAIRDVPSLITAEAIDETVRILDAGLRSSFGLPSPRIAVSGLNPHAGEAGTIGCEDRDIIEPAIKTLFADGIHVTGPHSADTMFHREAREAYDAALTMYHDQALIPVKTLAFDTGVNVTLGLAFIRTSPDHGTAFELAGTGRANPASLISALRLADQLASNPMPAVGVQ